MGTVGDITGQKFSHWTVLEYSGRYKNGDSAWLCKCDCGRIQNVAGYSLRKGKSKSCRTCWTELYVEGPNKTHGLAHKTPLYNVWNSMKSRCYRQSDKRYQNYGARGVKVCDEWRDDFKTFYDWAIAHGYKKGLSIDRIDNNGDYCPENCRWATDLEQANNTTRNVYIEYRGKNQTVAQWAREMGLNLTTLENRLYAGWDIERALTTTVKSKEVA